MGIGGLQSCEAGQSGCGIGGSAAAAAAAAGAGRGVGGGDGGSSGGVDTTGGYVDDLLIGQGDVWMGKEQMDFDLDMLTWGDGDAGEGKMKMKDRMGGM